MISECAASVHTQYSRQMKYTSSRRIRHRGRNCNRSKNSHILNWDNTANHKMGQCHRVLWNCDQRASRESRADFRWENQMDRYSRSLDIGLSYLFLLCFRSD